LPRTGSRPGATIRVNRPGGGQIARRKKRTVANSAPPHGLRCADARARQYRSGPLASPPNHQRGAEGRLELTPQRACTVSTNSPSRHSQHVSWRKYTVRTAHTPGWSTNDFGEGAVAVGRASADARFRERKPHRWMVNPSRSSSERASCRSGERRLAQLWFLTAVSQVSPHSQSPFAAVAPPPPRRRRGAGSPCERQSPSAP
jgi:hypothetical protein